MQRSPAPASPPAGIVLLEDEQFQALRRERVGTIYSQGYTSVGAASRPGVSADATITNDSRASGSTRGRFASGGSNRASHSPRTNFTTRNKLEFGNDSGDGETLMSVGSSGKDGVGEHTTIRRSNPFITINERDSLEAIKVLKGNRSGVNVSVPYTLLGAVVGTAIGILLSYLDVSDVVAAWVSIPGTLFLRAIKSLVVPYVFFSVAVAIGDIVYVGKVSAVGIQTLIIFFTEAATASLSGLTIALLFRPYFQYKANNKSASEAMAFVCDNNLSLEMQSNGALTCTGNPYELTTSTTFRIFDVNNVFKLSDSAQYSTSGLSDQLITILGALVPNNIFSAMYNVVLLSIITFATVMGAVAGRNFFNKTRKVNYLYVVLLQLRNTFFLGIEWVIWGTPVAVVFIIAGALVSHEDELRKIPDVYTYLLVALCASVVQIFMVIPIVFFLFTRCNPYTHMKFMIRAYVFGFCSASSLATTPITLSCIQKARVCSQSLANFVISVGVVANVTGAGWYYPVGIVFLAESSGNGDELTATRIVVLYLLTLIACFCTPPIPGGGLQLMSILYQTILSTSDPPSTWALFVAMNVVVDRLLTVCNVNDVTMSLKVIAENTDETVAADMLGRRD